MAICFEKQWRNEHGKLIALPHYTTKNDSFLKMSMILKKMGIKNYAFPLCLYDPDLLNVNPHDLVEDTPQNEILRQKVMIESRNNVWYFLREVVKIFDQGGEPIPFQLSRGSMAMTWCFLNGIDYWGMQPRQAQPLTAGVLTPNGYVPMGTIVKGSEVIAADGSTVKVSGVFPHGVANTYRMTLEDGSYTECCKDHLWRVYCPDWGDQWKIYTLQEIVESREDLMIPKFNSKDYSDRLRLRAIEFVGQKPVQCIEIDHPDHLYVTDFGIISHNTGKTICAITLTAWMIYCGTKTFNVGHFTKDDSLRTENIARVKMIRDYLPAWFVVKDRYKDKDNATILFYSALTTKYQTMVAQKDPGQADRQARGISPSFIHIDEIAFCPNIGISYSVMLSSTDKARANAKKNGQPHSNIITTTAGDPSRKEAKEAASILEGAMNFTEHLYDIVDRDTLHRIVEANSPKKLINGTFSHIQLGLTNEWLREKIVRNNMSKDAVCRDYLNRWVSIQEAPIIPKDILNRITASEKEASWIDIISDKFVVYWYVPREVVESTAFRSKPFVLGCDSSEMIGRDATTMIGIDPVDLSVICSFRMNEGNINVVGSCMANFMLKYPKSILVPENKSSGTSIIDIVSVILRREGHNPFKRIFNWVVNNRDQKEFAQINIHDVDLLDTTVKKYFGIKTDKTKRDELYTTTLMRATEKAACNIRDGRLISELSSLTERNGRVDHAAGGHDDTVIAFLMAMWFILNAKHLDIYGISPGSIMSRLEVTGDNKSQEIIRHEKKQMFVRNKLEQLREARKKHTDPSVLSIIDGDIRMFESMLDKTIALNPETADDFYRDPNKFTDKEAAASSRPDVSQSDVKRSFDAIFSLVGR